ncbi:MAG: sulfatase-like hydrolase/transferase [Puniceicoccaceae bacterium]
MKHFITIAGLLIFVLCIQAGMPAEALAKVGKPNIVLIFIDDMGYGDIGPFGNKINQTPNLDRMANEGNRVTHFYVSNTNCTPSRSALMTGTYAHRIGMAGDVCFPGEKRGLNPSEFTIAEAMKSVGYKTGAFGKWHMGDQWEFLPLSQGFDEYFGIPYSNDMWPGNLKGHRHTKEPYTPLPVIRNEEVVAYVADGNDQALLTRAVSDEAIKFIKKNKKKPFFCFIPYPAVHRPRFVTMDLAGKAEGDVERAQVEELDTHIGRILDTLRDLKLDDNTFVLFTSDNGPAGGMTAAPLRGQKGGPEYEGHKRMPTITWWPGTIPAGSQSDQIVASIDVLPSLASLAGAELPTDRIIDGKNSMDVFMAKPGAVSKHPILYYEVGGIRRGKWKLLRNARKKWELYDLSIDISEKNNLAKDHPETVKELARILKRHVENVAANTRVPGMLEKAEYFLTELGNTPRLREYLGEKDARVLEGQ